jgi:hypothetical protein
VATIIKELSQKVQLERRLIARFVINARRNSSMPLPVGSERELVLAMTYMLVVFSILVQGLTIKQVVIWFMRSLSIAVKPRSRS